MIKEIEELQDKVFELEKIIDFLVDRNDKYNETINKIKEILKESIDDEFYINLTNKEKALDKIYDLLEEIE